MSYQLITNLLVLKIHHFAPEGLKLTKWNDLRWSLKHARVELASRVFVIDAKSVFKTLEFETLCVLELNGSRTRITLDKACTASQFRPKCLNCEALISGFTSLIEGSRKTLELCRRETKRDLEKDISFLFVVACSLCDFKYLLRQIIRRELSRFKFTEITIRKYGWATRVQQLYVMVIASKNSRAKVAREVYSIAWAVCLPMVLEN